MSDDLPKSGDDSDGGTWLKGPFQLLFFVLLLGVALLVVNWAIRAF